MIIPEIRKWLVLGAIFVLLLLLGSILAMCHAKDEAREANAGKTIADGRTAASADVNDIRDAADERIAAINADVKDATDAIRNAPTADARNDAALRGLCDIDPSASPDCRLLDANPR